MNMRKLVVTLAALLLAAPVAWAATPYGEATIEKGNITVMREGKRLKFDQSNSPIEIHEGDLIRVRRKSQMVLTSREKATITLGSNAVFQVKPWESRGKTGLSRVLFGKVRASITGLTGGERFNVKTATATIGVKGTGYNTAVNPRGDSMLVTTENVVQFGGQSGGDQDVGLNHLSVVVNGKAATAPVLVPEEVLNALSGTNLDSPEPNTPAASALPGEQALVNAGIITSQDAEEGKRNEAPAGDNGGLDDSDVDTDVGDEQENLDRAHIKVSFPVQ